MGALRKQFAGHKRVILSNPQHRNKEKTNGEAFCVLSREVTFVRFERPTSSRTSLVFSGWIPESEIQK